VVDAKSNERGLCAVDGRAVERNAGVFVRCTAVDRWVAMMFSGVDRDILENMHRAIRVLMQPEPPS
jgi:hypothetical protein